MVQKEVRRKTGTYGLIGVLLAVLLVAMIYSYGVTPGSFFSPSPEVTSPPNTETGNSQMKTFASYNEMQTFLSNTTNQGQYYNYAPGAVPIGAPAPETDLTTTATNTGARDYSTTNIQVAGVDEADQIKTDGSYIYVIGNGSQAVYILDANPTNARTVAKIFLNNSYISGIYLSTDGSKLAVMGNTWVSYYIDNNVALSGLDSSGAIMRVPYWNTGTTFVYVYNVANRATPVLSRNFTMSGSYVNSRMIGNYIYEIISQTAYEQNGTVVLPVVFSGPDSSGVSPTKIYYTNAPDTSYSYTTIAGLNIMSDSQPVSNMTILMGYAGNVYVSPTNIYITYPVSTYETITLSTPSVAPSLPFTKENGTTIAPGWPTTGVMTRQLWQGTAIYRVHVSQASIAFAAQGNVTGNVLSQYSMDENNGYFRIATNSYQYNNATYSWMGTLQNNLYVLNSNLQIVGKIENLATGENLHAARFMGNRCYLVTFQQVDPLFVVDLSQPAAPRILGNLTIPGFSDFLQPYDETHLIGIGQDANASIDANLIETPGAIYYTAILGLKVSLFDVSNVVAPTEIGHIVIGDRGTTSDALYDPKALLFDASRNLLVLPVNLYLATNSSFSAPTPSQRPSATGTGNGASVTPPKPIDTIVPPSTPIAPLYPQFVWQGVYVFNINLSGLTVRGNITQMNNADALMANPSLAAMNSYMWTDSNHFITRSLFIGNVLYTFSDSRVQLNSLSDLSFIAKIDLN
jgi:inhibitor of cysteine peptidase